MAAGAAPARPLAGAESAVERVEQAVVRVGPRGEVPARRATRRSWPATTRPRHHGRRATRWATNQCRRPSSEHRAEVDGKRHGLARCAAAPRRRVPPRVRHRSPPSRPSGGHRLARPPGRARPRRGPRRRCARRRRRRAAAPGAPHGLALLDRHRGSSDRRGTRRVGVDRRRRRGHHAAEAGASAAAAGGARAVAGAGATSPSWRSRSMSCLMLRTKSPPDSSSSSSTSSRSLARRPGVGQGDERRGRAARVSGRPASLLVGVQLAGERLDPAPTAPRSVGRREPRRRRRLGPRCS